MRIVVVNTAASSGGALSILKDFYEYIRKNDTLNEWVFLLSDYYLEETKNITIKVINDSKNKIKRLQFDNFTGYNLINYYNPDVVFSMQNTTIANLSIPQVLYLHQAIPFQKLKKYSFLKKDEFKYAVIQYLLGINIKNGLKRADKVVVQSNWMKEIITKYYKESAENIRVIPPSIKISKHLKTENSELMNNKFFYPGAAMPYKNNNLINQACNYIDSQYPNLQYEVNITVNEQFTNNKINSIGSISREKVFEKMKNEVLIFPSYIETFGLPLAEGRALNSLIFASDTLFSKEVLYGYENAYFFNPFDYKELANLMVKSMTKEIIKEIAIKDSLPFKNSWEEVYKLLTDHDNFR